MKSLIATSLLFFSVDACLAWNNTATDRQQMADIGNLKLESGKVINDCRVGYRTYGHLNIAKSNCILLLTWFGGTSKTIESNNPWHTIDTTRFYLVIVDALGDGVSSSPSNSVKQHGPQFPFFSVKDMVESQHELLTKKLGIQHVHAVTGISMGGIQTFQWAVSYPDFMDNLIPIVGSPRPTSYDLMFYNCYRRTIESDAAFNHGNYTVNPNIVTANMILDLSLSTPADIVREVSYGDFPKWMDDIKNRKNNDWNDTDYQITAIIGNDISRPYNGSMKEAAARVKAKMLIIYSKQDHIVNPTPAIEFSKLLPAKLVMIDSEAGHLAGNYDDPATKSSIIEMLAGN